MTTWTKWGSRPYFVGPGPQETIDYAQGLKLRPDDVVILTFPKTGTTWLQNICEQLKTGAKGFDHFSEITEVQPWLDRMKSLGQAIEEVPGPVRCFKSHQLPSAINPGAKYLTVCRNPNDVLLSWFAFNSAKQPWKEEYGDANGFIEKAGSSKFAGTGVFGTNVWSYFVELWEIRNEPGVLLLSYEHLKNDAPGLKTHLPIIAKFMGLAFPSREEEDGLYGKVAKLVSIEEMRKNANKFDDNFIHRRIVERGGKPQLGFSSKVDTHGSQKPTLNENTMEWMEQQWKQNVTPVTGHESYEEYANDVFATVLQQR